MREIYSVLIIISLLNWNTFIFLSFTSIEHTCLTLCNGRILKKITGPDGNLNIAKSIHKEVCIYISDLKGYNKNYKFD